MYTIETIKNTETTAIENMLELARQGLLEVAGNLSADPKNLVTAANRVAIISAEVNLLLSLKNTIQTVTATRGESAARAAVTHRLHDVLTQGADDSWSGRGNDLSRMQFDAVRKIASEILNDIHYGA